MKFHEIDRLADHAVLPGLDLAVGRNRFTTVEMLAYIAVADARRLYLAAGYPSMVRYCVGKLNMSEASAYKRIDVARAARKFPAIFEALAEGALNQSGVLLLVPCLHAENADELLLAAAHKTRVEIEVLLAERFPRADVETRVQACGGAESGDLLATGTDQLAVCQLAPGLVGMTSPEQAEAAREPRAKITPLSPQRFALQFTVGQEAHDLLVEARALLGHAVPSGDVAEVFLRAIRVYVARLKKQRFAVTSQPRKSRGSRNARHIPAEAKRAVWERDGGRCTFVSDSGHRCESRTDLEYDHVKPIASGGETTVENVRLLCHPHNQHAADQAFGRGFMDEKRREAQARAAEARALKTAVAEARAAAAVAKVKIQAAKLEAQAIKAHAKAAADAELAAASDVIPALENLGCRSDELRIAAACCAAIPDAPLKERIVCALRGLGRANAHRLVQSPRSSA